MSPTTEPRARWPVTTISSSSPFSSTGWAVAPVVAAEPTAARPGRRRNLRSRAIDRQEES